MRRAVLEPLRLASVAALAVFALSLAACGEDSDSDPSSPPGGSASADDRRPPVAQFEGRPITRAQFDAWFDASVANSRSNPRKEMMVVPDPPPHRRCLEGYSNIQTEASRYLRSERPKNECRAGWQSMMNSVMRDLISLRWIEAIARQQGLEVDDEEAKTVFANYLGTEAAKDQWGDQSYEDLVENLGEEHVLARARFIALQQKVAQEGTPPKPAAMKKYRASTSCSRGFRVPLCVNGPKLPEAPTGPPPSAGAGEASQ